MLLREESPAYGRRVDLGRLVKLVMGMSAGDKAKMIKCAEKVARG